VESLDRGAEKEVSFEENKVLGTPGGYTFYFQVNN
jgi:hypothetical protein